jgi:hypothetical protein
MGLDDFPEGLAQFRLVHQRDPGPSTGIRNPKRPY